MIKVVPFIYQDIDDLCANTYVLIDSLNNCVVIDPSKDYDGIVNYIKKNKLTLKGVLLTHVHFDHIRGVDRLVNEFNCPTFVGFEDEPYINDKEGNLSIWLEKDIYVSAKITTCYDNEELNLLEDKIIVISTPYHTIGSVSYYIKSSNIVFTGDSLFKQSVGRCDFKYSIRSKMKDTLTKLMKLPGNTKVYPGHGEFTSIEIEVKLNPFINK